MTRKINPTKEWLEEKYVIEKLNLDEISKILNVTTTCVWYWMKKHNIPRREKKQKLIYENIHNEKWLREQYEIKERSACDIANEIGCSHEVVNRCINEFKINKHPRNVGKFNSRYGRKLSNETKSKIKKTNTGKIQSETTRKKKSDSMKGEKHWNWRNGSTATKYCYKFSRKLKHEIRERFENTCVICGEKRKRNLSIHHVDYNKNTLCNGKTWGLIPLCQSCHSKTNFNRWYWFNKLGNYWAMMYWSDINGA